MKNRYYLMRHGESLANLQDRILSAPAQGCSGYGLSPRGVEQARAAAQASNLVTPSPAAPFPRGRGTLVTPSLGTLGAGTCIVTSDFLRARETALIVAEVLGCGPITTRPALRERFFGELEGCGADDYHKVWQQDRIDPHSTPFGVESAHQLATRMASVLDELEHTHSQQTILLVSHGDPLRFLQLWAAKIPLSQHLRIAMFAPAEIRALDSLPACPEPLA